MPILCSMDPQVTPLAAPSVAVVVRQQLRHDEQADALRSRGCVRRPGEDQVDDVFGQVVLAGADEDLGAGDRKGAVTTGLGLGAQDAEVAAGMSLGQAHRAGPFARDHLGQVTLLQLVGTVRGEGQAGALGQPGVHLPGHVAGAEHLAESEREAAGQALPAPLRIGGHGDPAVLAIAVVGLLEPRWRIDLALLEAQAVLVADAVGRRQHGLGEPGPLLQDALEQVAAQVVASESAVMIDEVEDVVNDETDVTERCAVAIHGLNLPVRCFGWILRDAVGFGRR